MKPCAKCGVFHTRDVACFVVGQTARATQAAGRRVLSIADGEPVLPSCAASMGCLCACHSAGLPVNEPCDTSDERARRIAATRVGTCGFCRAQDEPLIATLDADPDTRVCAECHADPRLPTTEAP